MVDRKGRIYRFLNRKDDSWLTPWARLRYQENIPTIELLKRASGCQEKEAVACVALLNLPDRALRSCAGGDPELEVTVLERRKEILAQLKDQGLVIELDKEKPSRS